MLPAMTTTSAVTPWTPVAATELGQAVHELVGQQIDLDEFTRRFLASRVYTLCPVRPGLFVMSTWWGGDRSGLVDGQGAAAGDGQLRLVRSHR